MTKDKKQQVLELLVQMVREATEAKYWQVTDNKLTVRVFFESYADKIDKVYQERKT